MPINIKELKRGSVVMAIRHVDPEGANVFPGTLGVVFEEADFHGEGFGPMVRWTNLGACNVYEFDVVAVDRKDW